MYVIIQLLRIQFNLLAYTIPLIRRCVRKKTIAIAINLFVDFIKGGQQAKLMGLFKISALLLVPTIKFGSSSFLLTQAF